MLKVIRILYLKVKNVDEIKEWRAGRKTGGWVVVRYYSNSPKLLLHSPEMHKRRKRENRYATKYKLYHLGAVLSYYTYTQQIFTLSLVEQTRINAHTQRHIHTYTHTHIHTYTHIHTLSLTHLASPSLHNPSHQFRFQRLPRASSGTFIKLHYERMSGASPSPLNLDSQANKASQLFIQNPF